MSQDAFNHQIAGLLCSRLCHELVGPLGALTGGFDMWREFTDDFSTEEQQMLHQSADRLAMRMKFYRYAYGVAGMRLIAAHEVMPVLQEMLAEHSIGFTPPDDALFLDTPEGTLWLVMNIIFLGVDIIKANGTVNLLWQGGELSTMQIEFIGDDAQMDDDFQLALKHELSDDKISAYNVHGVHNAMIAKRLGLKIMCERTQGKVTLILLKQG